MAEESKILIAVQNLPNLQSPKVEERLEALKALNETMEVNFNDLNAVECMFFV